MIQALRHQQQGIIAALLALIVIALPLAAYFLAGAALRARLINLLTLNAAVVFVGSLLILLIERGNRKRDPRRSYGMIGIGVSICLALITFGAPLLLTTSSTTPASEHRNTATTTLRNVAAVTRGAFSNANAQATNQAPGPRLRATAEPGASEPTAVAQALTAQTGLASADLLMQIEAGSTIADLVKANNGDLNAVITAIANALDEMIAAGGRGTQLIERLGSDTTQVATQLVNGELAQGARFLLPQLIGGESALPQLNGQAPNGGAGGPIVDTPAPSPTPTVPRTPTPTVPRPTRIVFPTATPTLEASATPAAEATGAASSSGTLGTTTCGIIVDYNLNLRNQPTTDGSTVLVSIPFGSTVSADAHTSDNWYHVAYDGQIGWVSGDYVTASAACADLPTSAP